MRYLTMAIMAGMLWINSAEAGCIRNNTVASMHVYLKNGRGINLIKAAHHRHINDADFPITICSSPKHKGCGDKKVIKKSGCYDVAYLFYNYSVTRGACCK